MRIRISGGYALTVEFEDRQAARVIVVDMGGRTLLFRGGDPDRPQDGTWWFTPGGGVEPGESVEDAAQAADHGIVPPSMAREPCSASFTMPAW